MSIKKIFIKFLSNFLLFIPIIILFTFMLGMKLYFTKITLFSITIYSFSIVFVTLFIVFIIYPILNLKFQKIEKREDWVLFLISIFFMYFIYFFFSKSIYDFFSKQIDFGMINSNPEIYVIMIPLISLSIVLFFRILNYLSLENIQKIETSKIGEFLNYLKIKSDAPYIQKIKNMMGDLILGIFLFFMLGTLLIPKEPQILEKTGNLLSQIALYQNILPLVFILIEIIFWLYLVQFKEEIMSEFNLIKNKRETLSEKPKKEKRKIIWVENLKNWIKRNNKLKKIEGILVIILFVICLVYILFFMPKPIYKEMTINSYNVYFNLSDKPNDNHSIVLSAGQGIKKENFYLPLVLKNNTLSVLTEEDLVRKNMGIITYGEEKGYLNVTLTKSKSTLFFNVQNSSKGLDIATKSINQKSGTYVFPEFEGEIIYMLLKEGINSFCAINYIDQSMEGSANIYKIILFEKNGQLNKIIYNEFDDGPPIYKQITLGIYNTSLEEKLRHIFSQGKYITNQNKINDSAYGQNYTRSYEICLKN